ncbi:membrane protein insertion efficiency factor YidD [Pseudohongiella nitratireducens]|nr:membrane protein insertion efficiency factor YidD [Pseudohongiella nitratireducens]MDF1623986.1 membrane protein insertion efficiency factor YidD [Pseudohongiella nitratireducens]
MAKIAIKLITLYQCTLSLLIGNQCRFYPSCSHYTQDAIAAHGILKGSLLGAKRILRCHPWSAGGYDPAPKCTHDTEITTCKK